jgi:hypothetical protein
MFPCPDVMATPCIARRWFKGPRALQPFHILQVNDYQTAAQVIPQHIAPLTVAVNHSVRPEHGQGFVTLLVEDPKTDGNMLSLQASEVEINLYFRLETRLLLRRGSLDDHSVSMF